VTNAEQFIHQLQTTSDLRPISEKYFGGEQVEGGVLTDGGRKLTGCELEPRTCIDILECRQRFKVIMIGVWEWPKEPPSLFETTTYFNCYSTPFTTKFTTFYSSHKQSPRRKLHIDLEEFLSEVNHK
jgi:hypothetical protein